MALIYRDPQGLLWSISVNPDGSLTTAPAAPDALPTADGTDCTLTLQSVVNLCRTHVELMPIADVGGFSNEPALSLANDTLQELCAKPFNWKFNSKVLPTFITQSCRQDYKFAGACAITIGGGVGIDLAQNNAVSQAGNAVVVNTLQPHNFKVGDTVYLTGVIEPRYNSAFVQTPLGSSWTNGWVITALPSPTSFTFDHALTGLPISGAYGIWDLAWLETGTLCDSASTEAVPRQYELNAVRTLKPTSTSGRPKKVSTVSQSNGVVVLRFSEVPSATAWAVSIVYQMKPPNKTALTDTWSPFPDEFAFVYRQMFLARCYRFLDHRRADAEEMKAQSAILKALGRDDVEDSDQHVSPEIPLMGGYGW